MIGMKNTVTFCIVAFFLPLIACSQSTKKQNSDLKTSITNKEKPSWSGAYEVPKNTSWRTIIPPKEEPGVKLIISGTVSV